MDATEPLDPSRYLLEMYDRTGRPRRRIHEATGIPEWRISRIMSGKISPTLAEASAIGGCLGLRLAYINTTPMSQCDVLWLRIRMDQEHLEHHRMKRNRSDDITT